MAPIPAPAAALPVPAGRLPGPGPLLALIASVLAGHLWLAQLLAPDRPAPGLARPAPLQVRSVVLAPAPGAPAPSPVPRATGLAPVPTAGPRVTPISPAPVPAPSPAPAPARPTPAALQRQAPAEAVAVLADPAGPATAVSPAGAAVAPGPAGSADTPAGADGDPPPLYATRVPPAAQLRYRLQHNGREAEALLHWQPDSGDGGYRLDLLATGPGGRALLAQTSTGQLDAHGVAPARFVDRRSAGPQRAANFRRDIGRIGYSGPSHTHPAWPGAQDRLSWLAQFVAVLAAQPQAPAEVVLFVADATGQAGLWRLQRQPDTADGADAAPGGQAPLQHWQRAAPRPEALQVDLWLPRPDAAAPGALPGGGWPVRLRLTVPRSGDVLDLALAAAP